MFAPARPQPRKRPPRTGRRKPGTDDFRRRHLRGQQQPQRRADFFTGQGTRQQGRRDQHGNRDSHPLQNGQAEIDRRIRQVRGQDTHRGEPPEPEQHEHHGGRRQRGHAGPAAPRDDPAIAGTPAPPGGQAGPRLGRSRRQSEAVAFGKRSAGTRSLDAPPRQQDQYAAG